MFKSIFAVALMLVATFAQADRIRDLTSVQGVRENSSLAMVWWLAWMARVTRPPRRHSPPRA